MIHRPSLGTSVGSSALRPTKRMSALCEEYRESSLSGSFPRIPLRGNGGRPPDRCILSQAVPRRGDPHHPSPGRCGGTAPLWETSTAQIPEPQRAFPSAGTPTNRCKPGSSPRASLPIVRTKIARLQARLGNYLRPNFPLQYLLSSFLFLFFPIGKEFGYRQAPRRLDRLYTGGP